MIHLIQNVGVSKLGNIFALGAGKVETQQLLGVLLRGNILYHQEVGESCNDNVGDKNPARNNDGQTGYQLAKATLWSKEVVNLIKSKMPSIAF